MSDNLFPWKEYDNSWWNEIASQIKEITRPAIEAQYDYQAVLKPLVEAVEQYYKPILESVVHSIAQASRPLIAIEKMGEVQYVCWDYLSSDFIEAIVNANNVNRALRELVLRDRLQKVNETIQNTTNSPIMQKHLRVYLQSVKAFQNADNELAVIGFTSVLDGLLSDISKNPTPQLSPRIKTVLQKLEMETILDNDEYATLALAVTLEKSLSSFSAFSDFSGKEPKELNRNWIAHGRSTRKRTKLDCVKMINLIYGLLLVDNLSHNSQRI